MTEPTQLPTFDDIAAAGAALAELDDRAKRIFAVGRWSGIIAVTEMVEGYDSAMRVVEEGPQRFYPAEDEWGPDKISKSALIAIAYVEEGTTP